MPFTNIPLQGTGSLLNTWEVELRSAGVLLLLLFPLAGCGDKAPGPAEVEASFNYPSALTQSCPADWPPEKSGNPPGPAPSFQVRKPANYDARFAHPLLIVYAPAGATAVQSERYVHLTNTATSRGFIVAYAGHRPMGLRNVKSLRLVVRDVARDWCIDPGRVFMTGHSDGGTVSTALALLPETRDGVAGIAPSAAGFAKADFKTMQCRPQPIPVMVIHGIKDKLFPGFGLDAAQWWAACNKCTAWAEPPDADGCIHYTGCAGGAPVMYCETPYGHAKWPGLEARVVDFLLRPPPRAD